MIVLALSLAACAAKHEPTPSVHDDSTPVAVHTAQPAVAPAPTNDAVAPVNSGEPQATAVAKLTSNSADGISGAAAFTQSDGDVKVSINLTDASPGSHVVTLREFGGCTFTEPAPGSKLDDLTVITADASGLAHIDLAYENYKLAEGKNQLLGRAVVVDGGKACGVITLP